jgi:hypothetical protein
MMTKLKEQVTTTLSFPLESRHFESTTSHVTIRHLPKTQLAGNKAADGSALNTGLSIWFGCENLVETIGPVLDECVPQSGGKLLELGAGTGLAGLFVMDYFAARGVSVRLDLTDGIDEALFLLEENLALWRTKENGNSEEEPRRDLINVTVSKNFWGQRREEGGFARVEGGYDLVYGADLVYERAEDMKVSTSSKAVSSIPNETPFLNRRRDFRSKLSPKQ